MYLDIKIIRMDIDKRLLKFLTILFALIFIQNLV